MNVEEAARRFLRDSWSIPDEVAPAWGARRRLAGALRELAHLVVTTDADADTLTAAAEVAELQLEGLRSHPRRSFREAYVDGSYIQDPTVWSDRSLLLGASNPLSPPLRLERQGDRIVGLVTFRDGHVGAPGWVHGGMVSCCFDQVLGYVLISEGIAVVTGSLQVKYVSPTPLGQELRFEAWMAGSEGRRYQVQGVCKAGDVVTAEATGTFVRIPIENLHERLADANWTPRGLVDGDPPSPVGVD